MRKFFYLFILLIIISLYSCVTSSEEKKDKFSNDTISRCDTTIISDNNTENVRNIVFTRADSIEDIHITDLPHTPPRAKISRSTIPRNAIIPIVTDSMKVENKIKNIGEIRHLIKNTMYYKVTDTVEMTISYKQNNDRVLREVGTFKGSIPSNITTSSIEISPYMRARLIDPTRNSFIIVPVTDTIQYIDMESNEYTLWRWMVTPIKGGNHDLILNVDMMIGEYKKSIDIYQSKIFVEINNSTKFWIWFHSNWTYITYVIGLIGAIFTFLHKEKIINIFKKKDKI